ncbi:MAG TPA: SDR family oxidoreductase [Elusimicrobiota bacterium]|nr:SDR family oxidoreductase [Elusimicrobiota bacterium]
MILVTGASGLLGSNLLLDFKKAGREVAGVYGVHPVTLAGVKTGPLDLLDNAAVDAALKALRPTWVVNTAAATNVDWCEDHPVDARRLNGEAPGLLADAARRGGARFIQISTDAVFDGQRGLKDESHAPAPINVYGRTKWEGENAVRTACPGAVIVRTNLYGWNAQPKSSLAEWMLSRLESGQAFPAFQDIEYSPLLVNDLGDLLLSLIDRDASGTFHVAGSEPLSKWDFARRLAGVFELSAAPIQPARATDVGLKAPRPRFLSLNVKKAEGFLGRPLPRVEEGLRRFRSLRERGTVSELKKMIQPER